MASRAFTLFLVAISTLGIGLWWAWPAKWSLETEVGIVAAPEFIYPYVSQFDKWHLWSRADTHGWEIQQIEADRRVQYRIPLQYRTYAKLEYQLKPDSLAEGDQAQAARLRIAMHVDFGWHVLARYTHRHLREETRQRFDFEVSRLRELAENDAKLAAAQKAADADSVSLVPMDTISTPMRPAE